MFEQFICNLSDARFLITARVYGPRSGIADHGVVVHRSCVLGCESGADRFRGLRDGRWRCTARSGFGLQEGLRCPRFSGGLVIGGSRETLRRFKIVGHEARGSPCGFRIEDRAARDVFRRSEITARLWHGDSSLLRRGCVILIAARTEEVESEDKQRRAYFKDHVPGNAVTAEKSFGRGVVLLNRLRGTLFNLQ